MKACHCSPKCTHEKASSVVCNQIYRFSWCVFRIEYMNYVFCASVELIRARERAERVWYVWALVFIHPCTLFAFFLFPFFTFTYDKRPKYRWTAWICSCMVRLIGFHSLTTILMPIEFCGGACRMYTRLPLCCLQCRYQFCALSLSLALPLVQNSPSKFNLSKCV